LFCYYIINFKIRQAK